MYAISKAVPVKGSHIHQLGSDASMKKTKNEPASTIRCVGERKKPSKDALDRFIKTYLEIIAEVDSKMVSKDQLTGTDPSY